MFLCCWTKERQTGDDTSPYQGGIERKLQNSNRLLMDFASEEAKIGLRDVSCDLMFE